MRDEVLIKRQLVAMVTGILANKRVREKCLQGVGKKREEGEEEKDAGDGRCWTAPSDPTSKPSHANVHANVQREKAAAALTAPTCAHRAAAPI